MSPRPTEMLDAVIADDDREYALCKNMIVVQDISKNPKTNDRAKKLGSIDATRFAAIVEFDDESISSYVGDGITRGGVHSRLQPNPDNWAPRFTKDGASWDLRIIVDDVNKDFERNNLSTTLIDECNRQTWAFLRDAFKIRKLKAKLAHAELEFNDAGIYAGLPTGGGKGNKQRGVLLQNISRRGGYVGDGPLIAQLYHVLHLFGKAGTLTCGEAIKAMLAIRGDVHFAVKHQIAHIVWTDKKYPETKGRPLVGVHWIGKPDPTGPSKELSDEAAVSNQTIIPPIVGQGARIVVFDEAPWTSTPGGDGVPPNFPDRPGTVDNPTITGLNEGYWAERYASTGNDVGTSEGPITIPEELPTDWGLNFEINVQLPSSAITGDIGVRVNYFVQGPGEATPVRSTVLSTTIASGTGGSVQLYRVNFFIPAADLRTKQGGKVGLAFYRHGADDQLDDLDITEHNYLFGPKVKGLDLYAASGGGY